MDLIAGIWISLTSWKIVYGPDQNRTVFIFYRHREDRQSVIAAGRPIVL